MRPGAGFLLAKKVVPWFVIPTQEPDARRCIVNCRYLIGRGIGRVPNIRPILEETGLFRNVLPKFVLYREGSDRRLAQQKCGQDNPEKRGRKMGHGLLFTKLQQTHLNGWNFSEKRSRKISFPHYPVV